MKIKINPKYEEMRSFIERIPDVFEKEGRGFTRVAILLR